MPESNPRPRREIGDHGMIGNQETAALVARDGTVDFLCWPRLDSPSVFAALLDPDHGGAFELWPDLEGARAVQIYLPDTNVLMTRWLSAEGCAEVVDLMPHPDEGDATARRLIRRLRVTKGRVAFHLRCRPRFDYARETPACRRAGQGALFQGRDIALRLDGSVPIEAAEGEGRADLVLDTHEEAWFVLGEADAPASSGEEVRAVTDRTAAAWRSWARRSTYRGRWREHVTRSALVLKLLTSAEHGSVAAAATFGLPEAEGGVRNWDYRATWIRDASFTVYAFMRLGYLEEAERFRRWVGRCMITSGDQDPLRVVYALAGGEVAREEELSHLAGYGGARPVRIGNAAGHQRQLDIYGELLDSVYLSNKYGSAISRQGWSHIREIVEHVRAHWREADAGIWEVRGEAQEFLHSRLMCWVALDRAARLARKRSLPAPVVEWEAERDRIAENIWDEFRHPQHGYFVRARGSTELDGALLMMPLVRFVSATDPVWLSTLVAIRNHLSDDGLILRYRAEDGLPGQEGAFSTCTFWYAECLARAGRLDEAQLVMERGLRHANHLGLFSEEWSALGEPLGNFPQALTHLAFVSAAFFLDRQLSDPTGQVWQP
ncbi:glycoside hydrolase family 15 protein [Rubellimicrobium arenae]|uniref:glycoside hydrolase family 15 protein n=1 Tax=Rubellimicrobium arenae TaxID=2817372 RepID=UPI001B3035B8|nr:glycoside hydrolase family 15 protein [Rubellimicrobium arenae]